MNLNCRSNIHLLYTEGTRFGYPLLFMPKKSEFAFSKADFQCNIRQHCYIADYKYLTTKLSVARIQHLATFINY